MSIRVAQFDSAPRANSSQSETLASPEDVLRASGRLSAEALARARMAEQETGERFDVVVTRLGLISEDAFAMEMAKASGLERIVLSDFPQTAVARGQISPAFLRDNSVLPLSMDDHSVIVAVVNPFDAFVERSICFALELPVTLRIARASDIDATIDRLYRDEAATSGVVDDHFDEDDVERLKDMVSDAPVIRAVNRLIAQASDLHASDIHVEPTENSLAIRLRVDGVLREMEALPAAMRAPLVSRIKVMSGLNIAERRLPQDGRLRIAVRGQEIDLRIATAPSIHGESVVMRILDRSKLALDFPSLGFDDGLIADLRAALRRPFGIVLVTGPTGSGKTTTLYAALSEINSADRKLLTIEDPIEYRLPGVVQAQVNPAIDFTFSAALRSFLRQDPDVMMVGEIRDSETAEIAVQAALTGHMILSTLHTNSAAGAITRLIDMGVEPFLLSSVLTGILAQRLVRKLCTQCREPYLASPELCVELGIEARDQAASFFYRAVGCDACKHSGYDGRIGVFEFLRVDDVVSRLILQRADARAIASAGSASGMRTLRSDGIARARAGLTTVEEAVRVASGD
jgi:general secretion pathway protein E